MDDVVLFAIHLRIDAAQEAPVAHRARHRGEHFDRLHICGQVGKRLREHMDFVPALR